MNSQNLIIVRQLIIMKLNLVFVGDIFPANLKYNIGFGVASQFAYKKGECWLNILKQYFIKADIYFGNLESPLVDKEKKPEDRSFAGCRDFALLLKKMGIDIVSIANNHILEQGIEGFFSTKESLKDNKIRYVGDFVNNTSNVEILEVKGITIGIAGFSNISNSQSRNIYAEYSYQNVIKALNIMSSFSVDCKIMTFYWGDEYINIPSKKQIVAAHKFIDLEVDIIVGHHPHVIQPVERYKKGLIFYSLGNFIFDMIWSDYIRLGMIANVTLEKGKEIEYNVIPIYIGNDYIPREINNFRNHQKLIDEMYKRMLKFSSFLDNSLSNLGYDKLYESHVIATYFYQRIMIKVFIIKHLEKVSDRSKKVLI